MVCSAEGIPGYRAPRHLGEGSGEGEVHVDASGEVVFEVGFLKNE